LWAAPAAPSHQKGARSEKGLKAFWLDLFATIFITVSFIAMSHFHINIIASIAGHFLIVTAVIIQKPALVMVSPLLLCIHSAHIGSGPGYSGFLTY